MKADGARHLTAVGNAARDIFSGILDLIYPPHCVICRTAGEGYLCGECREKIVMIEPPVCRKCGTPCEAYTCDECRDREYAFECARSAGIFEDVLREAIHALKYRNLIVMADPLAELMAQAFPSTGFVGLVDIIVPIPIHSTRMVDRGFNQSQELAVRLGKRIALPVVSDVLRKGKKTKHQVELPFDLRATNIDGSFGVSNAERIRGKRVLLIDDVFTTGSTLDEAARVLLASGASAVRAYTLAKSL